MIQPDTLFRDATREICRTDDEEGDYASPSVVQSYASWTVGDLANYVRGGIVLCCAKYHEDTPTRMNYRGCPLREFNLACGHQETYLDKNGKPDHAIGTAMAAACHVLRSAGMPEGDLLLKRLRFLSKKLNRLDEQSFIAYRELRGDADWDYTNVNPAHASPKLNAAASGDELQALIRAEERLHGGAMAKLRDDILAALVHVVPDSYERVPEPELVQLQTMFGIAA